MLARASRLPRFLMLLASVTALSGFALYGRVTADTANESAAPDDPRYSKKLPLPDKHTKKDPVEANGKIFEDPEPWPKPDATLVFTGSQIGYLEPCGCAGLTNQKGGLKRRHTFLKQLARQGWNPVPLDAGSQIKRFGKQAEIKLRRTLVALQALGYQGVGFGEMDVRTGQELPGILINLDPEANPMVSANVGVWNFDEGFSKRYGVVTAGGIKIGFTSVLSASQIKKLPKLNDVDVVDPADALKQVVPKLVSENCDQLVLLVNGTADDATALAKQFTVFNWVVAGMGADVPLLKPQPIEGTKAHMVEVGKKGMYAVSIGLYKNGDKPWRYEDVPMDHRFDDSPEMQEMLVAYQDELKSMTLKGLGIKAMSHPTGQEFAGSESCSDCHLDACDVWEGTPHSHALDTLVKLDPPRHYDPECLSCHVTGWNPQKYVPYNSGYVSQKTTPKLFQNGCENCHGPAAKHVAVENGDIDLPQKEIDALRQALHMEIQENEGNKDGQVTNETTRVVNNCLECHDEDNSPDFDFQLYWPWVEHHGNE